MDPEVIEAEFYVDPEDAADDTQRRLFVYQRGILSVFCVLCLAAGIGGIAFLSHVEPIAMKSGRDFLQARAAGHADGLRKVLRYEDSQAQTTISLIKSDNTDSPEGRETRIRNIYRFRRLLAAYDATAKAPILLGNEPSLRSFWVDPYTGKTITLNATENGRMDDRLIGRCLAQDQVEAVLDLSRARASRQTAPDPDAIIDRDLAAIAGK